MLEHNRRHWADTDYPATRRVMGPERTYISDDELEQYLIEIFPGASGDDVEDLMRSLQRFTRQAAPYARRALSGAVQGGLVGAAGGAPGIVAGALAGGIAGALTTPGKQQRSGPPAPPVAPTVTPATTQPPTRQVSQTAGGMSLRGRGQGGGASQQALQQLLYLLSRPETMQALLALLMGRSAVPLGSNQVPAAAFASAIAELAAEVACGDVAVSPDQSFFFRGDSEPRCDLADPAQRARLLVNEVYELAQREAHPSDINR